MLTLKPKVKLCWLPSQDDKEKKKERKVIYSSSNLKPKLKLKGQQSPGLTDNKDKQRMEKTGLEC